MLAHVATAAAQNVILDVTAAAQRLQQNESEKVEQLGAEFSEKPMAISADGRKRLASSLVVQRASSPTKYSTLPSCSSSHADRSKYEANSAVDFAASNDVRQSLQCQTPRQQRRVVIGSVS